MKKFNFKDFKYALIDSSIKGYKEVLVTYNADGVMARQCLFIKESKGKGNDYYIKNAKGIIDERIKSGQLAKSTAKQFKKTKKGGATGGALKPVLATLAILVGLGAAGTGGYFLGHYLSEGEIVYHKGDRVVVDTHVDDPTGGKYEVNIDTQTATVGTDYVAQISLKEKAIVNDDKEYFLPETLDKVTSNKTVITKYEYKLDESNKRLATVKIPGEYVYGPVEISFTLKADEPKSEVVFVGGSIVGCWISYEGQSIKEPGNKIILDKTTGIELVCKPISTEYKLSDGSFKFSPDAECTYDSEKGLLTVNNVKSGTYTLDAVASKLLKITIGGTRNGCVLKDSEGRTLDTSYNEIEIAADEKSYDFGVEITNPGDMIDEQNSSVSLYYISGGSKNIPLIYEGNKLTVKCDNFSDIKKIDVNLVAVTPSEAVDFTPEFYNCESVTYKGQSLSSKTTTKVTPVDGVVKLVVTLTEDYYLCEGDVAASDGLSVEVTENEGKFDVVFSNVNSAFNAKIDPTELPETRLMLTSSSTKFLHFTTSQGKNVPFYDLSKLVDKTDIDVFAVKETTGDNKNYGVRLISGAELKAPTIYKSDGCQIILNLTEQIKEKSVITIDVVEPKEKPTLGLDKETVDKIQLTDDTGKEIASSPLIPKKDNVAYFKFKEGVDVGDIVNWTFSAKEFGFSNTKAEPFDPKNDGVQLYKIDLYLGTDWEGYDLFLNASKKGPTPVETVPVPTRTTVDSSVCTSMEIEDSRGTHQIGASAEAIDYIPGGKTVIKLTLVPGKRFDTGNFVLYSKGEKIGEGYPLVYDYESGEPVTFMSDDDIKQADEAVVEVNFKDAINVKATFKFDDKVYTNICSEDKVDIKNDEETIIPETQYLYYINSTIKDMDKDYLEIVTVSGKELPAGVSAIVNPSKWQKWNYQLNLTVPSDCEPLIIKVNSTK